MVKTSHAADTGFSYYNNLGKKNVIIDYLSYIYNAFIDPATSLRRIHPKDTLSTSQNTEAWGVHSINIHHGEVGIVKVQEEAGTAGWGWATRQRVSAKHFGVISRM